MKTVPTTSLNRETLEALLKEEGYVVSIGSINRSHKLAQEIGALSMHAQPNRSLIYIDESKMTDDVREAFNRQVKIEDELENQFLGIND